jgi:hypothetical protein
MLYSNKTILLLFLKGGDADPALNIYNMNDSLVFYYTMGPAAFFDEAFWLDHNSFIVLGFSFLPGKDPYQQIFLLWGLFQNNKIIFKVYKSEKLPGMSNWIDYFKYCHPYITF